MSIALTKAAAPPTYELASDTVLDVRAARDADADTLTNLEEFNLGLNPRRRDTDGDGLDDNLELENGLGGAYRTLVAGRSND